MTKNQLLNVTASEITEHSLRHLNLLTLFAKFFKFSKWFDYLF